MTYTINDQLGAIARDRLSIDTLAVRNSDALDFHDVSVAGVTAALRDAYDAGMKAGIAHELGIIAAAFVPHAERFPWQVFCFEERCVLLSHNLKDHVLIASAFRPDYDERFRVPVESLSFGVLDSVRRELRRTAMSDPLDPSLLDDLFHGCAITAFVEQASVDQSWPCSEATRRRAYLLYEEALSAAPHNAQSAGD